MDYCELSAADLPQYAQRLCRANPTRRRQWQHSALRVSQPHQEGDHLQHLTRGQPEGQPRRRLTAWRSAAHPQWTAAASESGPAPPGRKRVPATVRFLPSALTGSSQGWAVGWQTRSATAPTALYRRREPTQSLSRTASQRLRSEAHQEGSRDREWVTPAGSARLPTAWGSCRAPTASLPG